MTIGTGQFEKLVRIVDDLAGSGIIKDVTVQIGLGEFIPQHCKYFRFADSLDPYYDKADLVISHGGPGTVFEILRKHKKLIAVSNTDRTDPMHQVEFLAAIAETGSLLFCKDASDLPTYLKKADTFTFTPYEPPACTMDQEIIRFLEES